MKILIVEQEKTFAQELYSHIRSLGFKDVSCVNSITKAASETIKKEIDLLIIDILVCKSNEWIFLDKFSKQNTQIIYLTACKDDTTITKAILTEPVGYLLKPYNKIELMALLKLVDFKISKQENIIYLNEEYQFNRERKRLYKKNHFIKLSAKEKNLLSLLTQTKNSIVSFDEIEELWDEPPKPSTLRTMIYRLRSKLEHKFIITIPNQGLTLKIERF